MELTYTTFLIVVPLVFLAGLVDAIGGGGGLISLPAYLFAGLPAHAAVGTNKLSSSCGTTVVTIRLIKNKLIDLKLAIPAIAMAILGSSVGTNIALIVPEEVFVKIMVFLLPVIAFLVLNKKIVRDDGADIVEHNRRNYICAGIVAFIIGIWDGMYGPGTGTFLIIAFTAILKMSLKSSNGLAKIINLTTNITSMVIFLTNGCVIISLGLAAAAANMLGGYIGAGLAIKNGSKIIRPVIVLVLVLLLIKMIFGL